MRFRKWLRGCKLRQFKKWYGGKVPNSGYYYSPKEYDLLISQFEKIQVGDLIYNPYTWIIEKVKEIYSYWEEEYKGRFRILHFKIKTESGYILYNIDEQPTPEIIEMEKKMMEDWYKS